MQVEMCISKLNFIMKGDVVSARELVDPTLSKDPEDSERRLHLGAFSLGPTHHCGWNSFQRTEALSVLNNFLKRKRAKCHCEAKNPTITKPTLGLIYMVNISILCSPYEVVSCKFFSLLVLLLSLHKSYLVSEF